MAAPKRLTKDTDYETSFWCGNGFGILREEVWVDEKENVVRYNLAFILPHLTRKDNGRVLGYDNAHGLHERHYMGVTEVVTFKNYDETMNRFRHEVAVIRRRYED